MPNALKHILSIVFLTMVYTGHAQKNISGKVTDLITNVPLAKVKISLADHTTSTITDKNGTYQIAVPENATTLIFSLDRYFSESINITTSSGTLDVNMILDTENLRDVVLVGSRFKPRSIADSPVPIDNIKESELRSAGHHDLDMTMMYNIPSFNTSIQTVSDATAHFNPADLRGLGPSRTLILVNGKRKNSSAHVYINDTPGKGEVGVDLTTIPIAAIERVEVLRNAASAQYGSDAIAGVINIVLKENIAYGEINSISGLNQAGDGLIMGFDTHFGIPIEDKGFINVSTNFKIQEKTNRAPDVGTDLLFGNIFQGTAQANITQADADLRNALISPAEHLQLTNTANDLNVLGTSLVDGTNPWLQQNPGLGMILGQPEMTTNNLFYNVNYAIGTEAEIYSFGGTTYRNGESYGIFRAPYMAEDYGLYNQTGFLPNFQTNIHDITLTAGLRGSKNGWVYDISTTRGKNEVSYTIGNTLNDALATTSPTRFDAGGYLFSQVVNNLDISKSISKLDIGFGFEFRNENFVIESGEENSYIGAGAISFPGIQPTNEVNENRHNLGVYLDLQSQLTKDLLLGGAIRYENYSDFGSRVNWMIQSKLDLVENIFAVRGSWSTGFRAPSLHQIHLSNIQTLISAGTISEQGTFKNNSTVLRTFDIKELKEESSTNISVGLTFNPSNKLFITADYFNIHVDDRIVFTGAIGDDGDPNTTTQTESILHQFNITSFKFFTNAIDTHTDGVDVVVAYNDIRLGTGSLSMSLTGNYSHTVIDGALKTSQLLESEGNSIFDRQEQGRIESARPDSKAILRTDYTINKFNIGVYNTYFGTVTWQHASDETKDQTFSSKILSDLNMSYQLTKSLSLSLGSNNIFNVYPDEINSLGDPETDLGGRLKYSWEVNQFGFNGRFIYAKVKFTL
jgi:iron complex outermembrane receptor protein